MTQSPSHIRPYRAEDLDALVQFLLDLEPWKTLRYARPDWERIFSLPFQGREAFIVEMDGRPVGVAMLRRAILAGDYLELFAIASSAQHQGHGTELLRHLEGIVFGRAKNLFVCVSDFNKQGQHFYEQNGYQAVGRLPDLLISGSDEILLRKTTGPARSS
jgi:ribosomal protein S18 acetylase RimI-like enzyme